MVVHLSFALYDTARTSWVSAVLVGALLIGFGCFGYLLSATDLRTHRLPNKLTYRWFLFSLLILGALALAGGDFRPVLNAVLGMLLLGGGYLILSVLSSAAMGMGDVKLAAVLGLNLGYFSLSSLFLATLLTFVTATAVLLVGVASRKLTLKSAVPFGPFMVFGALVALLMAR